MKVKNYLIWLACAFTSIVLTISCTPKVTQSEIPVELTISSAIALTEPLQAIKPIYQEKHPNIAIIYNFGASGELRQQIASGAPVDVFISAAQKDMDELEKANLLATDTRNNLVKNQIVLVTPRDSNKINSLQDLMQADITRIAVGNPDTVPIGRYSEEIFKNLGLLEKVQPKLILGKNVRQVLGYVEAGNVDAGLVWVTDAKTTDKVKVIEAIPENLHSPAIHPIAVIAASKNPKEARDYVQFLLSDQSKSIFEQYGFTPVL